MGIFTGMKASLSLRAVKISALSETHDDGSGADVFVTDAVIEEYLLGDCCHLLMAEEQDA